MANDIGALRACLFDALRGLNDKENPLDIERARAMSDVAQTLINSMKVELEYQRLTGGAGTGFIPAPAPQGAPALPDGTEQTSHGTRTTKALGSGATVTQHRMR